MHSFRSVMSISSITPAIQQSRTWFFTHSNASAIRTSPHATSACSAPQCTEHAAGALPAASQFAGRPTPDKLCGIAASTFVRTHCPRAADLALAIRTCKLLLVKPCQTLTGPCQLSNFDIDTIDKV